MSKEFLHITRNSQVNMLVSIPHSGITIPTGTAPAISEDVCKNLYDTDWHVHELYNPSILSLQLNSLKTDVSRYVIDVNRRPDNKNLYDDGRIFLGLVPEITFENKPIYARKLSIEDVNTRKKLFYTPYHAHLRRWTDEKKMSSKKSIIVDGHSIKRNTPFISKKPIADIVLGTDKHTTLPREIFSAAVKIFKSQGYTVQDNQPFSGGYITRHYGSLNDQLHTLQIELAQDIYMNEVTQEIIPKKFTVLQRTLKDVLEYLLESI